MWQKVLELFRIQFNKVRVSSDSRFYLPFCRSHILQLLCQSVILQAMAPKQSKLQKEKLHMQPAKVIVQIQGNPPSLEKAETVFLQKIGLEQFISRVHKDVLHKELCQEVIATYNTTTSTSQVRTDKSFHQHHGKKNYMWGCSSVHILPNKRRISLSYA